MPSLKNVKQFRVKFENQPDEDADVVVLGRDMPVGKGTNLLVAYNGNDTSEKLPKGVDGQVILACTKERLEKARKNGINVPYVTNITELDLLHGYKHLVDGILYEGLVYQTDGKRTPMLASNSAFDMLRSFGVPVMMIEHITASDVERIQVAKRVAAHMGFPLCVMENNTLVASFPAP